MHAYIDESGNTGMNLFIILGTLQFSSLTFVTANSKSEIPESVQDSK